MTRAPGEAVLELVDVHRREAEVVRKYDPHVADIIEHMASDYERIVNQHEPEWLSLRDVQRRTGWSLRKLRNIANELVTRGMARMDPFWQIRREAAAEIQVKPGHREEPPDTTDIHELARHLGRQRGAA